MGLAPITVTSMQIVRIPWAHTSVRVELGTQEMERIAKVTKRETENKERSA